MHLSLKHSCGKNDCSGPSVQSSVVITLYLSQHHPLWFVFPAFVYLRQQHVCFMRGLFCKDCYNTDAGLYLQGRVSPERTFNTVIRGTSFSSALYLLFNTVILIITVLNVLQVLTNLYGSSFNTLIYCSGLNQMKLYCNSDMHFRI